MSRPWRPERPRDDTDAMLIGDSDAMHAVRRTIARVAASAAPVLVTGPSGSGKMVAARAVHAASPRRDRPLVTVNCGAITPDRLEAELFGGGRAGRRGRFEEADGGTLFLDAIEDMPLALQGRLLHAIEQRTVAHAGMPVPVDVRIVAAAHRDLQAAVDAGRFREILYYRLAVLPVALPPLAARRADVAPLAAHFLRLLAPDGDGPRFAPEALARLAAHRWPGNVRELRNLVERAVILHPGALVDVDDADALIGRDTPPPRDDAVPPAPPAHAPAEASAFADGPVDLRAMVAALEHRHIAEALRRSHGVVTDAARLLSLQRTTLIEKMHKYGIVRELA